MTGHEALLPCPFCGKHPNLAGKTSMGQGVWCCVARCSIEEWNTRAQPDKAEAVERAFEDLELIRTTAGDLDFGSIGKRIRGNIGGPVSRACDRIQAALSALSPTRDDSGVVSEVELKYLRDFHHVAQSLIGTVSLHLGNGDMEKAMQRMAHYKNQLPEMAAVARLKDFNEQEKPSKGSDNA